MHTHKGPESIGLILVAFYRKCTGTGTGTVQYSTLLLYSVWDRLRYSTKARARKMGRSQSAYMCTVYVPTIEKHAQRYFVIHYARRKFPTVQPVDSSFFSDLHALLFFLSEQGFPTDLQGSL